MRMYDEDHLSNSQSMRTKTPQARYLLLDNGEKYQPASAIQRRKIPKRDLWKEKGNCA
jgi:hypothetical protein